MRYINSILAISVLASAAFIPSSQAQETLSKSDVEVIIKEYLMENPEVLIDSLESYRDKQEQQQARSAAENIKKHEAYLTRAEAPSIGNPEADVTVIEFFDYNCGYCRRAVPDIQKMLKEDKNVRFVFKEMPILSQTSHEIAKWSLAAHEQGKYFEYHAALMSKRGANNAENFKKIAKGLGLDPDQLEKDAKSEKVAKDLEKSIQIAREIGVRGTPAFIIDGELYPGYLGEDGLRQAIEKARQNSDKKEG